MTIGNGFIGDSDSNDAIQRSYAHTWRVYVGNNSIWSENPECPGGPFLKSDFKDYMDNSSTVLDADKMVPGYGFEAWCNLPGRYTFFRATGLPSTYVTICSVAVTGTKYIRDTPI